MSKVLITDALSARATEIFRARGIEVDERIGLAKADLAQAIADYDGLAVRSATKVTAEVLGRPGRLRVIGRAGIGVDNIDVAAATKQGVVVMNAPFGNAITTAEHAIALLFAVARQIGAANASTHAGKWEKARFMGVELYGKCLGIIGCGNIGAIVADRAIGLHMKVAAYDPYLSPERAKALGVEKVELDELYARADFITLHTPLTDATRAIVNRGSIAKMKKGVFIVNCARGGLVVEADLKAALESGHVAGAALDVFAEEPAKSNLLFGMEQVVATPHLGASTTEAQEKVAVQIAEQMADYLEVGAVVNAVNMPAVSAEDAPKLRPYMRLARQLGNFVGQLAAAAPLKRIAIEYEGAVAQLNTRPLTAIALEGVLAPSMETVNMVNAPVIAKERGIEVGETKYERAANYASLIRVAAETGRGRLSVSGTLFADEHPRLVEVNGIEIEAELAANMLFVTNHDKPGFIGRLGTVLGDAGVNIATFHLGRRTRGGEAIALVEVDDAIAPAVLDRVRDLPHVKEATALCCF
ncbi:MAG: phosphoglycerate dehydrogenase [Alphaproteobacteria bacterium]|nr:phosphoglycerate dehydrogenase [Alphaproteobacteria bacterium]